MRDQMHLFLEARIMGSTASVNGVDKVTDNYALYSWLIFIGPNRHIW